MTRAMGLREIGHAVAVLSNQQPETRCASA